MGDTFSIPAARLRFVFVRSVFLCVVGFAKVFFGGHDLFPLLLMVNSIG